MEVAIIGAAGKMGRWFCNYFVRRGDNVNAYDTKTFQISDVRTTNGISDCVRNADFVLVCVPVHLTPAVIKQSANAMIKKRAVLAEISSVKSKTLPALRKTQDNITALCIHPMFGPGASEKKRKKMLVVPVRDSAKELEVINNTFADLSVKVLPDARTHDMTIAAVLGLTYFSNVAFACILACEDIATLRQVGGTTFAIQSMLAESVMTDEPELIAALIRDNPYVSKYMHRYIKEANVLASASGPLLGAKLKRTKKNLQKQADLDASYRQMYKILALLDKVEK
jgi:prephenate dehydrogenase